MKEPSATARFSCDLAGTTSPLPHVWEHTIGSGHATLALRADYQQQLARCRRELGVQHVRFHGLLSDDMGTLVDEQDALVYSFFNADQIFDFLRSIGMRPFVELSFMPTTLASGGDEVRGMGTENLGDATYVCGDNGHSCRCRFEHDVRQ